MSRFIAPSRDVSADRVSGVVYPTDHRIRRGNLNAPRMEQRAFTVAGVWARTRAGIPASCAICG